MRKLASIRKVDQIFPIANKDRIELAMIGGWSVIVKKDEFKVGDMVIYCEIDSVLPDNGRFEFLRSKKFRIKTIKMGGVVSQGICFPIDMVDKKYQKLDTDVTDVLGITKYLSETEKEEVKVKSRLPEWLLKYSLVRKIFLPKKAYGGFPRYIKKTDETRINNLKHLWESDTPYVVREKIDGSSTTFVLKRKKSIFGAKYEFIVCSRNIRLKENGSNFWKVARKYNIKDKLMEILLDYPKSDYVCLQGETIAPSIQGNRYKVTEPQFYGFNLFIDDMLIDCVSAESMVAPIKWCPLVEKDYVLQGLEKTIAYATGISKLHNCYREGLVFRNYDKDISFKAISVEYLLKIEKED